MLNSKLQIKTFDPHKATEADFVAMNKFGNRMQAEYWPEDPPRSVEQTIRAWRSIPPYIEEHVWTVWSANTIVALGSAEISRTQDNQHMTWFEIEVLPEYRRQSIAKHLLKLIAEVAQREKRRLMMSFTDSAIPAGAAFMKRLEARPGMESRTNQLNLADLDRTLLHEWQSEAPTDEFALGLWDGPYPEAEIAAIAEMKSAIVSSMPRDNLELEDRKFTKEELRQREQSLVEQKMERWTLYAKHRATGELAGYTEVFWESFQPETLRQGDTGVYPKYRNKGLGRWLKAAMIDKVLRERPQVKRIRTGNANSNAPMLKINCEMGFKPYKNWTTWQIELEKVLKYLEKSEKSSASPVGSRK
ncbi:GNAT family N-acetyltransferase [Candidatus Acetothermia bacterium]|nr:GNAT family N-acetyltransferase [Candidatus Acetothermia bacterium]